MRSKDKVLLAEIEKYVCNFTDSNGISPTMQEIANAVGVSKATVHRYISQLCEDGVIDYSVKLEDFKVNAFVDDKEVKILSIQNMTEQYGNQKMGAFLMMLDYKVRNDDTDIHQIRITAENTKHHEKGENLCYFQSADFE